MASAGFCGLRLPEENKRECRSWYSVLKSSRNIKIGVPGRDPLFPGKCLKKIHCKKQEVKQCLVNL